MAIIISQAGKNAQRVEKSGFAQEDYLQKYIYDNPESLPLYEIDENTRLLIVSREFPTTSGPIDAIGFDGDGEIYIIETKLYKNPDKRKVVAQILDYGAALSFGYSDFNEFLRIVEDRIRQNFSISLDQKLQQFFNKDAAEVTTLLESIKTNFSDGKFKFLVLMDKLEQRLKDLIMFISRNSTFNIYGIEMEYYKFQDYEIIIPKLFGVEVKKGTGISTPTTQRWNEASFFDAADNNLETERVASLKKIYDFFKSGDCRANKINWGTGRIGSFNVIYSRFSLYALVIGHADGHLYFPFNPLGSSEEMRNHREQLRLIVEDLGWSEYITSTNGGGYARIPVDVWESKLDELTTKLRNFIESYRVEE
jgi:hypothetical protein